jgi:hypothetical protein
MPPAPKLQPAIFGGLFIGVLSALPVINLGNCLCCMWVIGGGGLAVYLMQQNYPYAVQAADGALVGLIAGFIGGALAGLLVIPLALAFGPMEQRIIQRALEQNQDMPPEVRSMVENMTTGRMLGLMAVLGVIVRAVCFGVIAMLGGLLGVALFKKKDAPPPPGSAEVLPPAGSNP